MNSPPAERRSPLRLLPGHRPTRADNKQPCQMPKHVVAVIALATAITGCAIQFADGQVVAKVNLPTLEQFGDGAWVLRIDRACPRCSMTNPDQLRESDYRPISKGPTYPILITGKGTRVEIGVERRLAVRPPMKGARSSPTEPLIYNLDEGTFSGGRLVVWSGKDGLQGELTIYGSGVYIITSERGPISRKH
jgi:hypothetical protein